MKQERLLDDLHRNLSVLDIDRWLPVWGERRKGKSTLAYWNAKWVYPDFDVEEHISWTAEDHIDKSLHAEKGTALILDEPISGMLSFDAMSTANKDVYRAATIIGERNIFHQVLGPSLKRFPRMFLEDYCDMANHVISRGKAELVKIGNLETNTLMEKHQHHDAFDFPPMPQKDESAYRKLKREFVQEHRDTDSYSEAKVLERQMMDRILPVLRRHHLVEPDAVLA